MWDCLHQLHVTQRQNTNIYYYFQELYLKKWDKHTSMSDHIGSFLNLKRCITEAGHKLDDILVVHAILHSLSRTNIWDIVRCNLLDRGKGLTLDILTAELISVHDCSKCDCLADEKEKMLKLEQMALFTKSASSSTYPGKKPWRGKSNNKPPTCSPGTKYHICGKEGHWAPECRYKSIRRDGSHHPEASANLAIERPPFLGERKVGQMFMASSDTISNTGILLDCGATFHMFTSYNHFTKYSKSSGEFVTVGGHNHVPVVGRGSVCFSSLLPNGHLNITLHNILHIPHLGTNLISLGALHRQGVSVQSIDNHLVLSKNSEELFRAPLTGATGILYYIQYIPLASMVAHPTRNPNNMRPQYCYIGHSHPYDINPKQHQYPNTSLS